MSKSVTKLSQTTKTVLLAFALTNVLACNQLKFAPEPVKKQTVPTEEITNKVNTVTVEPNKDNPNLDLLLVLDDSSSMKPDLLKLASRLNNFTNLLDASGLQWQMCLTTTQGYLSFAGIEFGKGVAWQLPSGTSKKILKRGEASLDAIFKRTIDAIPIGGGNSTDERGIRATFEHMQRNPECYRRGANVAVLLISDEDEASVGGIPSRLKSEDDFRNYRPLTKEELPEGRLASIRSRLGNVQFTFNSIIIKPGDTLCEEKQSVEAAAYSGDRYAELSVLTGGGVGSICDSDYSQNLRLIKERIANTLKSVDLECVPHKGVVKVAINGKNETNFKLDGQKVIFGQPVAEGSTVVLKYQCYRKLTPPPEESVPESPADPTK
ncbi:MAG: hypothetical protein ACLGGX_08845 [Bdellovibrionia bacterium]